MKEENAFYMEPDFHQQTPPEGRHHHEAYYLYFIIISASCSADMSIKLWDFHEFECVKTLTGW